MPDFDAKAVKLVNNKPALSKKDSKIIISNEWYAIVYNALPPREYKAGALLIWLMGQSTGFLIPWKTAARAIGETNSSNYYKVRKKLEDWGYITVEDGNLIINYEEIKKNSRVLNTL